MLGGPGEVRRKGRLIHRSRYRRAARLWHLSGTERLFRLPASTLVSSARDDAAGLAAECSSDYHLLEK